MALKASCTFAFAKSYSFDWKYDHILAFYLYQNALLMASNKVHFIKYPKTSALHLDETTPNQTMGDAYEPAKYWATVNCLNLMNEWMNQFKF